MKKLALLFLACLLLTSLPALAEVGLLQESTLQFDLPLVKINDVLPLPDGDFLLSVLCDDPGLQLRCLVLHFDLLIPYSFPGTA